MQYELTAVVTAFTDFSKLKPTILWWRGKVPRGPPLTKEQQEIGSQEKESKLSLRS